MTAPGARRPTSPLVPALVRWFDASERDLPWRRSDPWGVLVSEFMLQQTPVERVIPVWHDWRARWPTPAALAGASVADALRAWGRLGYPRRAARLHASAVIIVGEHDGCVPSTDDELRALPGVGEYTAAAVRAFAFKQRAIVLDTNVRRVVARTLDGQAQQPAHITNAERQRADDLWPRAHARSARWSAAVMEFGAVVCTARAPQCSACPIIEHCSWTLAGQPAASEPARRQAAYEGSDREARGRIMHALRESAGSVSRSTVEASWPEPRQRDRVLAALVADGLVERRPRGRYALPGD